MDNDDRLIGRLLSRREAIALIGVGGAGAIASPYLAGFQQTTNPMPCVVKPELMEGPFFVDKMQDRSDVRTNTATGARRDGVALVLSFAVSQIASGRCSPLPGAIVDLWQCDAVGVYSGVADPNSGAAKSTDNALRGVQPTNAQGVAAFTTIYPGWYRGRAVHVHFKVRTKAPGGQAYEYTSQLFFPEPLNDEIHALQPYASHGRRDMTNERDGIYRNGGEQLLLSPKKTAAGYDAGMNIALDLTDAAVGRPDAEGARGRGRGRGRGL